MAENSKIEWTDHTFNPWWGCVRVSPGCVHCYAETFDRRVHGKGKEHWGVLSPRRFFGDKHWNEPLRWNAAAEREGVRRRVFCASMADVLERRDELVPHRARLALLIQNTPWLDWLLLTKRPENAPDLLPEEWVRDGYPPNVWVGTTCEDQQRADERIPHLLRIPAAVRFLSCEPLLGAVDLTPWVSPPLFGDVDVYSSGPGQPVYTWHEDEDGCVGIRAEAVEWVIAGGESGPGARPMDPAWARSLRDQCVAAGVPFFFKQWGEWAPTPPVVLDCSAPKGQQSGARAHHFFPDAPLDFSRDAGIRAAITGRGGRTVGRVGKHAAGRELDGREWNEMPAAPQPAPAHG